METCSATAGTLIISKQARRSVWRDFRSGVNNEIDRERKKADMDNIYIMDHPLIQHKISILRNKNTGTNEFRRLTEEIAVLMGYEALRDLPLEDVEVETPLEKCMTPMISGKKLAVVPVLRAGLGMVNGITTLVPSAKIGHIGLYRDPVTH